jgi:hypothetical protein
MAGYEIEPWSDFGVAQLGASAALLGLVFVGLSINLRDVVASPRLVHRAGETVATLASLLIAATLVLIPDQARSLLGVELLLLAATTFVVIWRLQLDATAIEDSDPQHAPPRGSALSRRLFGLGAPVLLAVAGLTLAIEAGGGLYWWPPAVIAGFVGALLNAWVLLIEILR